MKFTVVWMVLVTAYVSLCTGETWTRTDGRTLDAEFVSLRNGVVTLRTKGGLSTRMQLATLNADGQARIKQLSGNTDRKQPLASLAPSEKTGTATTATSAVAPADFSKKEVDTVLATYEGKEEYQFYVNFMTPYRPTTEQIERNKKEGIVPFTVTVYLGCYTINNGLSVYTRAKGNVNIAIFDENDTLIVAKRMSLSAAAPS